MPDSLTLQGRGRARRRIGRHRCCVQLSSSFPFFPDSRVLFADLDGSLKVDGKRTLLVDLQDSDQETLGTLLDTPVPAGFFTCSNSRPPGLAAGLALQANLQALTAIKLCSLDPKVATLAKRKLTVV